VQKAPPAEGPAQAPSDPETNNNADV
jgi:hypothetical protein